MAGYTLLASESTVHVLSTTDVLDAVRSTVQTPTHSVIAASIVPQTIWGTAEGVQQLNRYAFNIDSLISGTQANAAIGNQSIDANGLTQQVVTFTVNYIPPGNGNNPLSVTVDVPNAYLEEPGVAGEPGPGYQAAHDLITAAYDSLVTMAGG